jgi:hypothetical protein
MAKQRRNNSASSALGSLLSTIGTVAKVELADNPEALAEVEAMVAGLKDSNYVTAAEHLDDNIETAHQVDAVLEEGGINPVELRRNNALAGAAATVTIEQAIQGEAEIQEMEQGEQGEQDEQEQEVGKPPAETQTEQVDEPAEQ